MKELFVSFLSVSIPGCFMIGMIILIRVLFKKAPKTLICLLWLLAIVRLLLPIQIETPWSLRPDTPVLSVADTQLFTQPVQVDMGEIPAIVPQKPVEETGKVVVDYLSIAGAVWGVGACLMGLYTLISYWRLKFRVREAVRIGDKVYVSANLDTAFLLGYLIAKVYIPAGLDAEAVELVIAHERMHAKRGDNWLKLAGFICLTLHWFNPMVWIAYALLCRDIEDACDEQVVRTLDVDARKAYSTALLNCSKRRSGLTVCPVAFGEISIKQRILNVLNYKRPAIWICVALGLVIGFTAVFFMTDPASGHPAYYDDLTALMGRPLEVVCDDLGVSYAEVAATGDNNGNYTLPFAVTYQGVPLELQLGISVFDGTLCAFRYVASYENNKQQAARDTVAVAEKLQYSVGPTYQSINKRTFYLKDITEEGVLEQFENKYLAHEGISVIRGDWKLTEGVPAALDAYLKDYKASDNWQRRFGDHYVVPDPQFYATFSAWHDPETQISHLSIAYHVGIGISDMSYTAFVDRLNWWDRLLFQLK